MRLMRPSAKIKVVPRDGEIEITLNINISVDGQVTALANNADVDVEDNDKPPHIIPDFMSGAKLNSFGKVKQNEITS